LKGTKWQTLKATVEDETKRIINRQADNQKKYRKVFAEFCLYGAPVQLT
jgi:hypothetical protein